MCFEKKRQKKKVKSSPHSGSRPQIYTVLYHAANIHSGHLIMIHDIFECSLETR